MMRKTLFSIIGSLAVAAGSVSAGVVFSDGFENPTFDGTADRLSTYNLDDQAGSLAPQAYVGGAGFNYQVKDDPANASNTVVQTFGDNEELSFGYATNFEYSQMSIEVDISVGTTEWNSLVIGNTAVASQTGSELFAVRLLSNGDVVVKPFGSDVSDPTITFSSLVPTTFSKNTIRVDFTNTAYDGTGTATLDLWVNGVRQDLNGAISGVSYTRTGFTDNFISFATQAADVSSGFSSGTFDNISIAIPEPNDGVPWLSLMMTNSVSMEFEWVGSATNLYSIESCTSLVQSNWAIYNDGITTYSNILGVEGTNTLTNVQTDGPVRFFRLLEGAGSVSADVLVSDGFENPTFTGTADRLTTYDLNDQTGSLAPLAYSIDGAISKFQVSSANPFVQTFANEGEGLAFGYATNFEYSEMSIEVDIARKSSAWSSLVIGNTAAASQTGSELFAVRLTSAGDVVVQLEGSGGSTLTFAGLVPNSAALYTVRVDFVNTAYDGTGTATLDLFINDVQQDLNGAIAGMSYTRTGFTDNYISFATQGAASGPDGAFENISIIASVAHGTD